MSRITTKPRVLYVVYKAGRSADGGVESTTRIIEHLSDCEVTVATNLDSSHADRWRAAGAAVHIWDDLTPGTASGMARLRQFSAMARFNARLVRLARGHDVVHCSDIFAAMLAAPAARIAGSILVLGVRDTPPDGAPWRLRWRMLARLARSIVVLSREMAERARTGLATGGRTPRIDYVYSIVDTDVMRPASAEERIALRARLAIPADAFTIAYVGTVVPKKAQLAFLQHAAARIVARTGAHIEFIGDFDPAREEYARACDERAAAPDLAGHVRFAGYQADVQDWYRAADLVVLASRNEGLARCMIEGLACGTPVVSFDVCSAREILEQHACGRVVPQGDYDALVNAVVELADPDLRGRLGRDGAAAARRLFDARANAARYSTLYHELMATP